MKKILISVSDPEKNTEYKDSIEAVGCEAVLGYCPEYDESYDALLLGGGVDINPKLYGEEVNGAVKIDDKRDSAEKKLLDRFLEDGKPVFAICRGCQFVNAYFGGTLYQHLPNTDHHRGPEFSATYHGCRNVDGEFFADAFGKSMVINSIHHEAVKTLGKDLIPLQYADDGIVESFRHKTLPVLAVQWHPERLSVDEKLLKEVEKLGVVSSIPLFRHFVSMI